MPWGRPMVGDTWKPRSVTSSCAAAPSSSAVVTPGSISSASASVLTPRASRSVASSTALRPVRPRAVSPVVGSRTPVTTTGASVVVSLGIESGCWAPASAGSRSRRSPPTSKRGSRNAERGTEGKRTDASPYCSDFRVPRSAFLVESTQPRDFLPQDERVDVVRPLVRIDRFEVREVTHRLILRQDAVRAQQPARLARHVGGDTHVVPLGERYLLRRGLPLVLQPPELQAEELRFGDLAEHLGESRLLQLESADRLAEHH